MHGGWLEDDEEDDPPDPWTILKKCIDVRQKGPGGEFPWASKLLRLENVVFAYKSKKIRCNPNHNQSTCYYQVLIVDGINIIIFERFDDIGISSKRPIVPSNIKRAASTTNQSTT